MTLTGFLLDRIAEDERDPGCEGVDEYKSCHDWTERRVVECEAKRQIIVLLHRAAQRSKDQPSALLTDGLRILALPYADHPDYKPEWRP